MAPSVPATGTAYREGRADLTALLAGQSPERLRSEVPACPRWTVLDTTAHVVGVCADAIAGRMDGVTTEPWTDAQVQARRGSSLADLLTEWEACAPTLEGLADDSGGGMFDQWLFDFVTHEQDLRGALDAPGGIDSDRGAIAARWAIDAWGGWLTSRNLGVVLVVDDEVHELGTGGPCEVRLTRFEALRSLTGRRSLSQIEALPWDGDPTPVLGEFTWGPFVPRSEPLHEVF